MPQWQKKWEYPYLIEVTGLDSRLMELIKYLSVEEKNSIVLDKNINKAKLFRNLDLNKISNPDGGNIWETSIAAQDDEIAKADNSFINTETKMTSSIPSFWFVAQGKSYNENQGHKYNWAPYKDKVGKTHPYWDSMLRVKKGDIIFNYANSALQGISIAADKGYKSNDPHPNDAWEGDGTRIDLEHYPLTPIPISVLKNASDSFKKALQNVSNQPFDKNDDVKQGYLYDFNYDAAKIVRSIYGKSFPDKIEKYFPTSERIPIINTKHRTLFEIKKQIILYGPPGTGKTYSTRKIALELLNH